MEIILVVVIIGMLAAVVLPRLVGMAEKGRISAAKAQISSFKLALGRFESDGGHFPSTAEGLKALVVKPSNWPQDPDRQWQRFLDKREIPRDPWGNDYVYRFPSSVDAEDYDLFSAGPDGKEDTDDDIGNTQ